MKRMVIYFAVAMGLLATFSCNNTQQTETTTTETPTAEEKPEMQNNVSSDIDIHTAQLATDMDYVCGMKLTTDEMITDTSTYDGKLYGFCSTECKTMFAEDPKKYLTKK